MSQTTTHDPPHPVVYGAKIAVLVGVAMLPLTIGTGALVGGPVLAVILAVSPVIGITAMYAWFAVILTIGEWLVDL